MRKEENQPFQGIMVSSGAEVAVGLAREGLERSARDTARAEMSAVCFLKPEEERRMVVARIMVAGCCRLKGSEVLDC